MEPALAGVLRVGADEGDDGVGVVAGERVERACCEAAEEREAAPGGEGFLIEADMPKVFRKMLMVVGWEASWSWSWTWS